MIENSARKLTNRFVKKHIVEVTDPFMDRNSASSGHRLKIHICVICHWMKQRSCFAR